MYEKERVWRLGDGKWENKEFVITNSATTLTCYFSDSGTDSSDDTAKIYTRYFGLGRGAYHVNIRPSGIVTITKVKLSNGTLITFADPITVGVTGYGRDYGSEIEYMVFETQAAAINFKIEVT